MIPHREFLELSHQQRAVRGGTAEPELVTQQIRTKAVDSDFLIDLVFHQMDRQWGNVSLCALSIQFRGQKLLEGVGLQSHSLRLVSQVHLNRIGNDHRCGTPLDGAIHVKQATAKPDKYDCGEVPTLPALAGVYEHG